MEDAFSKVREVFAIETLNKHQEEAIKFVVEKKKGCFCQFADGVWQVADLSRVVKKC